MGSAFFELGIGVSGLLASQRSLSVTSNNISNANTEGYSRQEAVQKASRALSAAGAGMIGSGTEVTSISRVRDSYLDTKFRLQNNLLAEYTTKSSEMSEISNLFNEPSDTGINSIINTMFSTLQDLTTNSGDSTYFENVKQSTETLLETINTIGESLATQQSLINDEISYTVDQINSIAKQIQALNIQINKLEINGNEASSLRDERDLLVDNLSEYINVEVSEELVDNTTDNYRYTVKINGQELVSHDRVSLLAVEKNISFKNPEDSDVMYDVKWASGFDFEENSSTLSGKLKALIDIRDGNGGNQMYGKVSSVTETDGVTTITVSGVARGDIGETGMIKIGGKDYIYSGSVYDAESNSIQITLKEDSVIEFEVGNAARVGTDNEYSGIPYYVNRLNEFVRTLAGAINEGIYRDGTSIDGMTGTVNGYTQSGDTGMYLITYTDEAGNVLGKGDSVDYEKMNIYNMSISKEIQESAKNLAISASANPAESQVDLIQELTSLAHAEIFKEGELADYMSATISEVAMDVNQADKYKTIQENLVLFTENKKLSVSGVENNEEMTNLIKFQSAYKASARIINVMNTVYDILVNGIFGG